MQPAKALLPHAGFDADSLLAPDAALATFFQRFTSPVLRVERVALEDAWHRILARDVVADADYPDAARSAMDGFAVVAADTPGTLRIAGDVEMGRAPGAQLSAGTTMRVPTGGVLPRGADAVVPIENARVVQSSVAVAASVASGDCVSPRGGDMRAGDVVLQSGRRICGAEAGVLATLGVSVVEVFARPLVAVVSSGDELISVRHRPQPGQIRDSNRYAIAATLRAFGANVRCEERSVPDRPGALRDALAVALEECDGAIVSGGSSVGEGDRTPEAVRALGAPGVIVHGLRVRPGKPTVLGAIGSKPVVGLPGNPASALTIAHAVAAPIVAALTGWSPRALDETAATLSAPLESRAGWTWYVPVALSRDEGGRQMAQPQPMRSSSVSLSARASGYVVMGEDETALPAGAAVTVRLFL